METLTLTEQLLVSPPYNPKYVNERIICLQNISACFEAVGNENQQIVFLDKAFQESCQFTQIDPANLDNLNRIAKYATIIGDNLFSKKDNQRNALIYYKNGIQALNLLGGHRDLSQEEIIRYSIFHKIQKILQQLLQ